MITNTNLYVVKLGHSSSISGARWCQPVNWEPKNEVDGAEFIDGSWWSDSEEEAGLICFTEAEEGREVAVPLDGLRVASCGEIRILGEVKP